MTAILQNVELIVGDTLELDCGPVVDQAGVNIDLTGASAVWRLAKTESATGIDVLLTKTSAGGIDFVLSGSAWTVKVYLMASDTASLPPSVAPARWWYHELKVTDASGNVSTVTTGRFVLKPTPISD